MSEEIHEAFPAEEAVFEDVEDIKAEDFSAPVPEQKEEETAPVPDEITAAAKEKLLRTIAGATAKRVEESKREMYVESYVESVTTVHEVIGFDSLLSVGDLRNLPVPVRLVIGVGIMIAGPLIIPKILDQIGVE